MKCYFRELVNVEKYVSCTWRSSSVSSGSSVVETGRVHCLTVRSTDLQNMLGGGGNRVCTLVFVSLIAFSLCLEEKQNILCAL